MPNADRYVFFKTRKGLLAVTTYASGRVGNYQDAWEVARGGKVTSIGVLRNRVVGKPISIDEAYGIAPDFMKRLNY